MRISKKILAIALAVLMAVSMMPFTALADDVSFTKVTSADEITAENIGTSTNEDVKAWMLANWDDIEKTGSDLNGTIFVFYNDDNDVYGSYFIPGDYTKAQFEVASDALHGDLNSLDEPKGAMSDGFIVYLCTAAAAPSTPVKPTATVTEVPISVVEQYFPDSNLDVAYQFVANADGDDVYRSYNADFVVSFDKAVPQGSVQLFGQYGNYPLTECPITKDLAANEEYRLLKDAMGLDMTYQQILEQVGTFYCGARFHAAAAGATMSIKLAIYETAVDPETGDVTETGTEVEIDDAEQTAVAPELPQAVVTDITNTEENEKGLDKCVKFVAPAGETAYDDELCDFAISFDQDVTSNDIELWGNYGSYGWVNLNSEASGNVVTFEAGKSYYLLKDIVKWPMTYAQIRDNVGTFKCGLNVKATAAGVTTDVQLALFPEPEEGEEPVVAEIGEVQSYEAPALPVATVTNITNTEENDKGLDAAYKFVAPAGETAYDDDYCDFVVRFDRDVTSDDIELWGKYGAYDWTSLASEASGEAFTFEAGKDYYLLKDVVKWPMTYGQIRQIGTFMCGINVHASAAGVTTNVELAIYEEPAEGEDPVPAQVGEDYDYVAPALPQATVTDITNEAENELSLDMAFKFEAPAGETAYDDDYCDFKISFDQDVTSDDLELWGKYGAYDWTTLASEASGDAYTFEAGKDYYLLKDVIKWPMTYAQIRQIGTFLCGVKSYYGANGVTMNVDLVLYDEPEEGEEPAPVSIDDEQFVAPDKPAPVADEVSITTADEIDINLYLSDCGEEETVEYTFNGSPNLQENNPKTVTVDFDSLPLVNGKRKLTITVAPAQIRDDIDIVIKNAAGDVVRSYENYSVAAYCDEIVAGNYTDAVKTLAKSVLDYGKAASAFFGYNETAFANQTYNFDSFTFDTTGFTATKSDNIIINEVRYVATSVPSLRFVVDMAEAEAEKLTATTDKGYTAKFVKVENNVILQVTGIPAAKLGETITITLKDQNKEVVGTIEYTPLVFAYMATKDSATPGFARLGETIGQYSTAANAVFA
jgi:hypothetical protein